MGTRLCSHAHVQYIDPICLDNGVQSVANGDCGTSCLGLFQGIADKGLGPRVKRRCGFVQEEDGGPTDQRSS